MTSVPAQDPDAPLANSKSQTTILSILFVLVVSGIGQSFLFASLPPVGREVGLSESQVGTIMMVGSVVFVIFSLVWGQWIDKFGLRRTIQYGMVGFIVTTVGMGAFLGTALGGGLGVSMTWIIAIILRGLFTASVAGIYPAIQAYFATTSSSIERTAALAQIGAAYSLGMVIGPALAAALSTISLTAPFYGIGGLAVVSILWILRTLPKAPLKDSALAPPRLNILRHPAVPFLILSLLLMFCLASIQQVAVFYIQDVFKLTSQAAAQRGGLAMSLMSLMMILVQITIVRKLGWSPGRLIQAGALASITGMILLSLAPNLPGIFGAMALFGAGVGLLFPAITTAITLAGNTEDQGLLGGYNASLQGVGLALGAIISTVLYENNRLLPFLAVGFVSAVLVIGYSWTKAAQSTAASSD